MQLFAPLKIACNLQKNKLSTSFHRHNTNQRCPPPTCVTNALSPCSLECDLFQSQEMIEESLSTCAFKLPLMPSLTACPCQLHSLGVKMCIKNKQHKYPMWQTLSEVKHHQVSPPPMRRMITSHLIGYLQK